MSFSLKALSNFQTQLSVERVLAICLNGSTPLKRWPSCLYRVNRLKNLLLQIKKALRLWILVYSIRDSRWRSQFDIFPFYGKVKFASQCICMWTMFKCHFLKVYKFYSNNDWRVGGWPLNLLQQGQICAPWESKEEKLTNQAKETAQTDDSFLLHMLRCTYQLMVLKECLSPQQQLASPLDFGYMMIFFIYVFEQK